MVSTVASDVVGLVGGIILSVGLAPQLWRMWRYQSAADVSLVWAIMYLTGLALAFTYLLLEKAVIGWATKIGELSLASVLLALKVWLDQVGRQREAQQQQQQRDAADLSPADDCKSTVVCVLDGINGAVVESGGGAAVAQGVDRAEAATLGASNVHAAETAASAVLPPTCPPAVSERQTGALISLRCTPSAAVGTAEEWRNFGLWLLDTTRSGAQAFGLSASMQHLEVTPSHTPSPQEHRASTASATASPPQQPQHHPHRMPPSSTLTPQQQQQALLPPPAPGMPAPSSAMLPLQHVFHPPSPTTPTPSLASTSPQQRVIPYEPWPTATLPPPGFIAAALLEDGTCHVVSEFSAASGEMSLEVLAVGPQEAVARARQLAVWLRHQLAGQVVWHNVDAVMAADGVGHHQNGTGGMGGLLHAASGVAAGGIAIGTGCTGGGGLRIAAPANSAGGTANGTGADR